MAEKFEHTYRVMDYFVMLLAAMEIDSGVDKLDDNVIVTSFMAYGGSDMLTVRDIMNFINEHFPAKEI